MKLAGKVAVVTGGARGIGGAIVAAFAQEGADVLIADVLAPEVAAPVLAAVERAGRRALYVPTDVSDEASVAAMADRALEAFGAVDVLLNGAGILSHHDFEDLAVAEWDRMIAVNLRGVFLPTHFLLPHMLERGRGKIISIASQLAQIGGTQLVHYTAAKAGVIGFTKALAREVSARGVHVNAIAPGPVRTAMMTDETGPWARRKLAEMPLGRFGDPEEIAPTAVFLASEDSSYYVGQTLCPNGGDVML
jgi:3-oxoacyl-[acyl-carrier protein] reductase